MDVSVGTRLRVLRKDAGLTQAQLAAMAGTNQAAINQQLVVLLYMKHTPGFNPQEQLDT